MSAKETNLGNVFSSKEMNGDLLEGTLNVSKLLAVLPDWEIQSKDGSGDKLLRVRIAKTSVETNGKMKFDIVVDELKFDFQKLFSKVDVDVSG